MNDRNEGPIRIALIDDDPSVRSAVSRLLRSHDFACSTYESAESALQDPTLPQTHCMVIDVQLPGMSGFALRDHLLRDGVRVPSVFITGHSEGLPSDWAHAMGNSPCLFKPFDGSLLMNAIGKLLESSGPRRSA